MNTDEKLSKKHLKEIHKSAKRLDKLMPGKMFTIMEICGGHTNVIMKYGVRELLPENVRLISGPGCPVCVSSQHDIDCIIELAAKGIPIATYGDMLKVPGTNQGLLRNLSEAKATGAKVYEVYAATEVLELAKKHADIVFFGVGFETTAPMTAFLLEKGICVYSVHKLVPPVMKILLEGELKIDGFINPGHVSTIIGKNAYQDIKIPQAIAGFTPERILRGISVLLEMIRLDQNRVVNAYPETVTDHGNSLAKNMLNRHFEVVESEWRGLGIIKNSGLDVKKKELNAKIKYKKIIDNVEITKQTKCRCGDILRGLIEPNDCPLYRKICTPGNPQGACMVSAEGSCAIAFKYGS